MAHKKAGGTAKNLRDSNPKYLGVKLTDGETAQPGAIIIRQRGTQFWPGKNVKLGIELSIFALTHGIVPFSERRHSRFNNKTTRVKVVSVKESV